MKDLNSLTDEELLNLYEEELFLLDIGAKFGESNLKKMFTEAYKRQVSIDQACSNAVKRVFAHEKKKDALKSNARVIEYRKEFENKHIVKPTKKVDTGVPSFIDNYDPAVHLINKFLSKLNDYSYMMVSGDSMINAGLNDGDLIIINKKKRINQYDLVAVKINGFQMVKRYTKTNNQVILLCENPEYEDIPITEFMNFEIVGVVAGKMQLEI